MEIKRKRGENLFLSGVAFSFVFGLQFGIFMSFYGSGFKPFKPFLIFSQHFFFLSAFFQPYFNHFWHF